MRAINFLPRIQGVQEPHEERAGHHTAKAVCNAVREQVNQGKKKLAGEEQSTSVVQPLVVPDVV